MTLQILGIVPARGGSKGIPRKNLAALAGKSMIAWTIEAALSSPSINRVIVSTEDREIGEAARALGAEVPFWRPDEFAKDDSPGIAPVLHAVRWLASNEDYHPDYVMLLQPTSPLRTKEDIEAVVRLARERQCDAVVSVTPAGAHPFWMKQIGADGTLQAFLNPPQQYSRRQDLPAVYKLNGAVYLIRREPLLEQETFYPAGTLAYVMPECRSLDVDSEWDLHLADLLLQDRNRHDSN
jgi:CMP-N,N'-diacetyllegionaminic acid synthase